MPRQTIICPYSTHVQSNQFATSLINSPALGYPCVANSKKPFLLFDGAVYSYCGSSQVLKWEGRRETNAHRRHPKAASQTKGLYDVIYGAKVARFLSKLVYDDFGTTCFKKSQDDAKSMAPIVERE